MYEDDEKYVVTPKGLFLMSLIDVGLIDDHNDKMANAAWKIFALSMEKQGYVDGQE